MSKLKKVIWPRNTLLADPRHEQVIESRSADHQIASGKHGNTGNVKEHVLDRWVSPGNEYLSKLRNYPAAGGHGDGDSYRLGPHHPKGPETHDPQPCEKAVGWCVEKVGDLRLNVGQKTGGCFGVRRCDGAKKNQSRVAQGQNDEAGFHGVG